MKKILTLVLMMFPWLVNAQSEHLRLNNVDWFFNYQEASVDTVTFEVKPKGIYTEIGMYLDFSTRGTSYNSSDSLEVEMLFKLPPDAEVIDMWLWINDTVIVADVYDKWTASQIYEDIVDRRTDPALLYRYDYDYWDWMSNSYLQYRNFYMVKIFPLLTSLPRKAKITYLIKNHNSLEGSPSISLPANILAMSEQNVLKTRIRFFPEPGMGNPVVQEFSSASFNYHTHPSGNYFETVLGSMQYSGSLTLNYSNQNPSDCSVRIYHDAGHAENFYQLQLKPKNLFNLQNNKKTLFLFDFIPGNSPSTTCSQLLSQLKSFLLNQFDTGDSVNFMFSGYYTHYYSFDWLPADSLTITTAMNGINSTWFNSYSNLSTIMTDGIQFIKNHNDIGSIVLIASSNSNGNFQQANYLINNLSNILGSSSIPIHIIDLNETNSPIYYYDNDYYYGNQYFYAIMSAQNTGEFLSIRNNNFNDMLHQISTFLGGYFSNFDIYITLENGYTYSCFALFPQSGMVYFDQVVQSIGKYNGTGRFRIIAHGQLPGGQLLVKDTLLDNGVVLPADSITRSMWVAQLIRELASQSQTNSIISQIIITSKAERVLSDYTAFLALEPGVGPIKPEDNGTTSLTDTDDQEPNSLSVYPNPFESESYVLFHLSKPAHVLIEIYDLMGKKLAVLTDREQDAGNHKIQYDAAMLSPGIYICRLTIDGNETHTLKMVKK